MQHKERCTHNMSRLLKRSKCYLQLAKTAWASVAADDCYIDITCFQLQQCVEFCIKYILEESCISYPKTHNISSLIDLLPESIKGTECLLNLQSMADVITSWEALYQYTDSFIAVKSDIVKCIALCEQLCSTACKFVKPVIPSGVIAWCRKNALEYSEICT